MFREGNSIHYNSTACGGRHDRSNFREEKKEYYTKDVALVKAEINKLKREIGKLMRQNYFNPSKEISDLITEKEVDLEFWKNKMSQFSNLSSHKKLKSKKRKVKENILKKEVLEIIDEAILSDKYFVTKEDIAYRLNVKVSSLGKIFMELNREGILSQARHGLMHDSRRGGFLPLMPGESGDWEFNS
jgi:ribosomal protein S25